MKRIFIVSIVTSLFLSPLPADLGLPSIQAVCKVILKDGREIEGIILVARSTYADRYQSQGFCFRHANGNFQLISLSLKTTSFTPNNYGAYKSRQAQLYFAQSDLMPSRSESSIEFIDEKEGEVLEVKSVTREKYHLLKEFYIYREIPLSLHLLSINEPAENGVKIDVGSMKIFELVRNPSESWLKKITEKRYALREKMRQDEQAGVEWVDYREPEWFHEILHDKKKHVELDQYFRR